MVKSVKTIILDVLKDDQLVLSTPISSPDPVVGLMSTLALEQNRDMSLCVHVGEVEIPDQSADNSAV